MATAPSGGGHRVACYEPLVPRQWPDLDRVLTGRAGKGATLYNVDPDDHDVFWDVTGVRGILRASPGERGVVEDEDALPRAFVTAAWAQADQQRAFEHLRDESFDFQRGVLLEADPGFASGPAAPVVAAEIISYEPERVVVEAEAAGDSLLVLSDSHYPGWQATVDGEPAQLLRANGLYRAVRLDQGRHRVVFEYAPASLRAGALLSSASLLAFGALAFIARNRSGSSS